MPNPYDYMSAKDNMPVACDQSDSPGQKDLKDPSKSVPQAYKDGSLVNDELPLKDSGMAIKEKSKGD